MTAPHFGRDWAGRLMLCTLDPDHRGRCLGAHGGTLRRDRPSGANVAPWVARALAGTLPASDRTAAR